MSHPTIISLTALNINVDDFVKQLALPTTGASVIFTGIVREITTGTEDRVTEFLVYEAYHDMAVAKMNQIADEIRKKWPEIEGLGIVQRIGKMKPGEVSTIIACTSAHRNCGIFEAARYGIDRLKEIVPVWKKEIGPTGEEWVEGHYHPTSCE